MAAATLASPEGSLNANTPGGHRGDAYIHADESGTDRGEELYIAAFDPHEGHVAGAPIGRPALQPHPYFKQLAADRLPFHEAVKTIDWEASRQNAAKDMKARQATGAVAVGGELGGRGGVHRQHSPLFYRGNRRAKSVARRISR